MPRVEDRSADQSVEIVVALGAGILAFLGVMLVGWLIAGLAVGASGTVWAKPALVVACVFGVLVTVRWLLRAQRAGL
jgi:hypothetical protein